ncbi:MAG: hypothetical protein K2N99_00830, partial [Malacoplasma sp.]|nr:hypothetical protein [Malacoplasma sp.]
MKRKFIKLLLSGSAVAFGTLTMSSCASSATNLFGIYASVDSNYDDKTTVTTKDNDNKEITVPAGYNGIFKGFKFNNFGFSANSSLIPDQTIINQENDSLSSIYFSHSWQDFMFPLLNYTISLSDLYNMDFSGGDITNLKSHSIITCSDENLLEQFIYSWANVLSKGKESIRFGVTSIKTKVTNPSESFFPQVSTSSGSDATQQDSDSSKLVWTWDDDKQETGMYTYTSQNSFQIGFEFGYWNAANDNANQGQSSKEDVINMVQKTGSWSSANNFNVENIKTNMWLVLNFNFSLTLSYSENSVIESKNENTAQENNHQDIVWTDELKNKTIPPIFSFTDKDKKIDIKSTSESVKTISDLIKSDSYDTEKVNNTKDKYLNQV